MYIYIWCIKRNVIFERFLRCTWTHDEISQINIFLVKISHYKIFQYLNKFIKIFLYFIILQ